MWPISIGLPVSHQHDVRFFHTPLLLWNFDHSVEEGTRHGLNRRMKNNAIFHFDWVSPVFLIGFKS